MIDHNAWLGHWPFRDLGNYGQADWLIRSMDRLQVEKAWVSPLAALFHRIPNQANQGLLEATACYPDRLIPVPVIVPRMPGLHEHITKLVEQCCIEIPAVRILPQCPHPTNSNLAFLKNFLADRTLVWTLRLVDDRTRHPIFPLPVGDLTAVMDWHLQIQPKQTLVTGCLLHELEHHARFWKESDRIAVDSSFLDGQDPLKSATALLGNSRVIDGSNFPLFIMDAMVAFHGRLPQPA